MPKKIRKRYLIKKGFQLRLISRIMLLVVFAVLLTGGGVLLMTRYRESKDDAELFYVTKNFGEDPIKITQEHIVFPVLLYSGLILLIIASIEMLFYSHRIAGPLYRINNDIKRMAKGEIGDKINLRKRDEFKELAESINLLKEKISKDLFKLNLVKEKLQSANPHLSKEEINEILKELKE